MSLYTLPENEIEKSSSCPLTKEQIDLLDMEDELHLAGKTKSYSWEEAKDIIRGDKAINNLPCSNE